MDWIEPLMYARRSSLIGRSSAVGRTAPRRVFCGNTLLPRDASTGYKTESDNTNGQRLYGGRRPFSRGECRYRHTRLVPMTTRSAQYLPLAIRLHVHVTRPTASGNWTTRDCPLQSSTSSTGNTSCTSSLLASSTRQNCRLRRAHIHCVLQT